MTKSINNIVFSMSETKAASLPFIFHVLTPFELIKRSLQIFFHRGGKRNYLIHLLESSWLYTVSSESPTRMPMVPLLTEEKGRQHNITLKVTLSPQILIQSINVKYYRTEYFSGFA